jgi:hypothetical protein
MDSDGDIDIKNLKPYKRLGYGTEGVIILTTNDKYTVKIYKSNKIYMKSYIWIVNYLQKYNLPTIYKSYKLLSKKNSLDRYINEIPDYFSYLNEDDLMKLSEKYNMKTRLIDIMKTYKITLNKFIEIILKDNRKNKDNILKSFYYQAIITLYLLYMKKGIVHKDINLDNYFVEKTNDKNLEITIGENTYNIKLYGYYLVLADFGHARSFELVDIIEYPKNVNSFIGSTDMNPYYELLEIINIFKKYIKINTSDVVIKTGFFSSKYNIEISDEYKILLKSYMKYKNFKNEIKQFKTILKKFKENYSIFINENLLKNNKNNEFYINNLNLKIYII